MRTALKKSSRKISSTRLETWATPGIPDVLLCDENGKLWSLWGSSRKHYLYFSEARYCPTNDELRDKIQDIYMEKVGRYFGKLIEILDEFDEVNKEYINYIDI